MRRFVLMGICVVYYLDRTHSCANFHNMATAYLWLQRDQEPPNESLMIWKRQTKIRVCGSIWRIESCDYYNSGHVLFKPTELWGFIRILQRCHVSFHVAAFSFSFILNVNIRDGLPLASTTSECKISWAREKKKESKMVCRSSITLSYGLLVMFTDIQLLQKIKTSPLGVLWVWI